MPTTLDRSSDARLAHAKRDTLALLETILGPPRDWSIAFRLWDGTSAGPADAPTTLVLVHPWSMRSLLWPPNEVNAGEEHYARTLRHWVANLEREHD
jgi:cyclopropane fatty-acyl-phospholipid synthase-like methyltransferase